MSDSTWRVVTNVKMANHEDREKKVRTERSRTVHMGKQFGKLLDYDIPSILARSIARLAIVPTVFFVLWPQSTQVMGTVIQDGSWHIAAY